ncbi:hypothetical protein PHET_09177 [Paragonimus heterotremus]|uniref:Uncharacterized protein n=1 Tax=Paragonimus heterotremus TaxID=100268 RepID=A0A8J4WF26_9TREM|nr:hypothetical protein PHET_09177 [Paragonimus heterotremus]
MSHSHSRSRKDNKHNSHSTNNSSGRHRHTAKNNEVQKHGRHNCKSLERSGSHKHSSALHKLTKRVHHMVAEDRQHRSNENTVETVSKDITSCGCPKDCGEELNKLRTYVNNLLPLLSQSHDSELHQLEHFINAPEQLLLECWTIIGAVQLRSLVSKDLMDICVRREKRRLKYSIISRDTEKVDPAASVPPFDSFEDANSQFEQTCGVSELWRRCLEELKDLSPEQIKLVLSGSSDAISIPPPRCNFAKQHTVNQPEARPVPTVISSQTPTDPSSLNSFERTIDSCPLMDSDASRASADPPQNNTRKYADAEGASNQPQSTDFGSVSTSQTVTSSTCRLEVMKDDVPHDSDALKTRVQREITELESRARAIRSLLKSNGNGRPR